MARPASVTIEVKKGLITLSNQKIKKIFSSQIKPFSSGSYISVSQGFNHHKVYVIVLEEKDEKRGS